MKKKLISGLTAIGLAWAMVGFAAAPSHAYERPVTSPCLAYGTAESSFSKITNDMCYQVQAKVSYSKNGKATSATGAISKGYSIVYTESGTTATAHGGNLWSSASAVGYASF